MPKNKEKNPGKMCQLIFLKIYPATETVIQKSSYIFTGNVKPYIQLHI